MPRPLAFFGAFNPPTVAHVDLAHFALKQLGAPFVTFVPSKSRYIQDDQGKDFAYSDGQRLAMLRAAAASRPWMRVTDWELRQPAQPRTYHTLCALREETGDAPALLMGSDKLPELAGGWLYVPEIAREFGIVCLARGQDACQEMIQGDPFLRSLGIRVVETPPDTRNVSSSAVRQRLAEIRAMVPEEVCPLLF